MSRERQVAPVFAELAEALLGEADLIAFLRTVSVRNVELLRVGAVALVLPGDPLVTAGSSDGVPALDQGPGAECAVTGEPVVCDDLKAPGQRWPAFAEAAVRAGFTIAHALPVRTREHHLGALTLFGTEPFPPDVLALAGSLADLAAIEIMAKRTISEQNQRIEQLQTALSSRIVIEQAKGVLAERRGLSIDQAFTTIRSYARRTNRKVSDVALAVLHDRPDVHEISRSS